MPNENQLDERIKKLTAQYIIDLAEILKIKYDLEPKPIKQTEYQLILKAHGANKLGVVKLVMQIMGLALKEAKAFVEETPGIIKSNLSINHAHELAENFKIVGAEVEITS